MLKHGKRVGRAVLSGALRGSRAAIRRAPIVRTPLPGFDPVFYAYWYRDVVAKGVDPLDHFLVFGWREGRDPSAGFSTRGYLEANPDVAAAGNNPLLHFLEFGLSEGRTGWQRTGGMSGVSVEPAQPMKLLPPPGRH